MDGVLAGIATVFIGAMGPLIAPLFINDKLKKESVIATKAACQASGHLGKMPIFFFLFGVDYLSDWEIDTTIGDCSVCGYKHWKADAWKIT